MFHIIRIVLIDGLKVSRQTFGIGHQLYVITICDNIQDSFQ